MAKQTEDGVQRRVMIACESASTLRDELADRFPDLAISCVARPEELPEELQQQSPEIVFSIKGPNFPAKTHLPIMTHPTVKWVQVGGSGYEHLGQWDRSRLMVSNCAGVLARHLAETVVGAMIALNGNFLTYVRQQQNHEWLPQEFRPLSRQTILIVGLGHIGQRVADHAKAMGMRVLATRRKNIDHLSVDTLGQPADLTHLLGEADVVSLHLRATTETNHLFDADMISAMKPNALFINTSRGSIVDETALIHALVSGHIRGAYLDVFEQEPLPMKSPLWSMQNVLITPHAADDVEGWQMEFLRFFADNLDRWLADEPLQNLV